MNVETDWNNTQDIFCSVWRPLLSAAQSSCSPSKSQHTSSTSEAVPPPTLSQNRSFSLPPGHAVCCFMDGGVGLYDMGAKKWDFLRDLVFYMNQFTQTELKNMSWSVFFTFFALFSLFSRCFQGHVETIFDCKFKPDDPNLLATASFDGTIKIWDTNTLTAVYTSPGNEGVVYSLSWAPGRSTPPPNTHKHTHVNRNSMNVCVKLLHMQLMKD